MSLCISHTDQSSNLFIDWIRALCGIDFELLQKGLAPDTNPALWSQWMSRSLSFRKKKGCAQFVGKHRCFMWQPLLHIKRFHAETKIYHAYPSIFFFNSIFISRIYYMYLLWSIPQVSINVGHFDIHEMCKFHALLS